MSVERTLSIIKPDAVAKNVIGQIGSLIWVVDVILWILLMIKAYQGEQFKLPFIGELAEKQIK